MKKLGTKIISLAIFTHFVRIALVMSVISTSYSFSYANDTLGGGWVPGEEVISCDDAVSAITDFTAVNVVLGQRLDEIRANGKIEDLHTVNRTRDFLSRARKQSEKPLVEVLAGVSLGYAGLLSLIYKQNVRGNSVDPSFLKSSSARFYRRLVMTLGVVPAAYFLLRATLPVAVADLDLKIAALKRDNALTSGQVEDLERQISTNLVIIERLGKLCQLNDTHVGGL